MARLIDADTLGNRLVPKQCYFTEDILCKIATSPTVDAVPLDKLCEWLAGNAFAFECKDCEEYCRALLECENEVGGDPEYWKNKLTEWMGGLDAK